MTICTGALIVWPSFPGERLTPKSGPGDAAIALPVAKTTGKS
jgi:hypothetical protein